MKFFLALIALEILALPVCHLIGCERRLKPVEIKLHRAVEYPPLPWPDDGGPLPIGPPWIPPPGPGPIH